MEKHEAIKFNPGAGRQTAPSGSPAENLPTLHTNKHNSSSNYDNIPSELKELKQWVNWKLENNKDGKPTKVPYQVNGSKASSTDEATWNTFNKVKDNLFAFNGIGFVFRIGCGYIGIDIDHCVNEQGELSELALEAIKITNTYCEFSQSGKGIHLIGKTELSLPTGVKHKNDAVGTEIYDSGRYFVTTGNIYNGNNTIRNIDDNIVDILKVIQAVGNNYAIKYNVSKVPGYQSGDDLIETILKSKNKDEFKSLFIDGQSLSSGNDASHSSYDYRLCSILSFWTGGEVDTIDTIFRKSALFRAKWDEKRGESTYGQITIKRAIDNSKGFYTNNRNLVLKVEGKIPPPNVDGSNKNKIETYNQYFDYRRIKFRENVLSHNIEYKTIETDWAILDDLNESSLLCDGIELGLTKDLISLNIERKANENRVNPIEDFFLSNFWDGSMRVDDVIKCLTQDKIEQAILRKWLVRIIPRVLIKEIEMPMLVLDGVQGLGKSTFCEWLVTPFGSQYFKDDPIDPTNKDHIIALNSTILWEVGELGATMKKSDIEEFKGFLTGRPKAVRLPYGKRPTVIVPITVFIGTINNIDGFLNDPTGSRRFLPLSLTKIDWKYKDQDPAQVWLELYSDYVNGFDYNFTDEEKAYIALMRKQYSIELPYEIELGHMLQRPTFRGDIQCKVLIDDLKQECSLELQRTSDQKVGRMIAPAMVKLGYKKIHKEDGDFWVRQK